MSQNKSSLNIVKKESGFEDIILRPLCAKVLQPTQMELSGMVDRERLLGLSGRSRKPQMELADKWNIKDYPSPAGGCKITEPNYSVRLKDLLNSNENPDERELYLLRIGRHFRCSKTSKIISTRTADEADAIKKFLTEEDTVFLVKDYKGSLVAIVGDKSEEDIELAAKIAVRYSKGKDLDEVQVMYGNYSKAFEKEIIVDRISDEELNGFMIK